MTVFLWLFRINWTHTMVSLIAQVFERVTLSTPSWTTIRCLIVWAAWIAWHEASYWSRMTRRTGKTRSTSNKINTWNSSCVVTQYLPILTNRFSTWCAPTMSISNIAERRRNMRVVDPHALTKYKCLTTNTPTAWSTPTHIYSTAGFFVSDGSTKN